MTNRNTGGSCSRRRLLKRSAMAAPLIGAPAIIPSSALGLGGMLPPSERITLGIVGLGKIMNSHLAGLTRYADVQIVAVCDVDKSRREEKKAEIGKRYAERLGNATYTGCTAYHEHEELVQRADIDACFICTPDHWHVKIALDAVQNGKDVYVEKPMSLTIHEGRILSDAVHRYGAVLQVGSQQRSNAAFRKAAEMVRNGWIGPVREVYARLGRFPPAALLPEEPVPEGFDYDRWLGPAPWKPYNSKRVLGDYSGGWRRFWDYGSRKNGDWGAHHYDIIQWALGKDASGPEFFFPIGYNGSEWQGYKYKNGPTVYRDHPCETGQMIEFHGEDGIIGVSRGNRLTTQPAGLKNRLLKPEENHLYESSDHRRNFLECIRSRKKPIADVEIGHRTATICHLSGIAERLGRPISWDPETENIVGDPEAAKWQDRPRRAPYML